MSQDKNRDKVLKSTLVFKKLYIEFVELLLNKITFA